MSIKKQKLQNEIDTLYVNNEASDSVSIKSKKDLKEKLQKGLDDIEAGRMYSIEETFE